MTLQPKGTFDAFRCYVCGRVIGRKENHAVLETAHVLCCRCRLKRKNHALLFPSCPEKWHDMYDHRAVTGDRECLQHFGVERMAARLKQKTD